MARVTSDLTELQMFVSLQCRGAVQSPSHKVGGQEVGESASRFRIHQYQGQQSLRGHESKKVRGLRRHGGGPVGSVFMECRRHGGGPVGSVFVECGLCGLHPGTCLSLTPTSSFTSFLPSKLLSCHLCSFCLSFLGMCSEGDTCTCVSISPRYQCFPGEAQEQGSSG